MLQRTALPIVAAVLSRRDDLGTTVSQVATIGQGRPRDVRIHPSEQDK
jgi:hypothetical protein